MENMYQINEVKLSYKLKQRPSECPKIQDSKTTYDLLLKCYDTDTIELRESCKVLLINRSNSVLGVLSASEGGLTGTIVDIKLILQSAILTNASGVIISHNHPSGNLTTSSQDDFITRQLKKACDIMDIQFLDHIIVTSEGYYSYADEGRL